MASLPFLGGLMRRTRARLRQVFGQRFTERELARIARRAWRNLCFNAVETFRVPSMTLDWVKRVADHKDIQMVFDSMKDGKGAVLAVPHMGNWELAGVRRQLLGLADHDHRAPAEESAARCVPEHGCASTPAWRRFLRDAHSFAGIARGLKAGKVLAILPDLRAKADCLPVQFSRRDGADSRRHGGFARRRVCRSFPRL